MRNNGWRKNHWHVSGKAAHIDKNSRQSVSTWNGRVGIKAPNTLKGDPEREQ
jgi:hypothetical protein